MIPGAPPPGTLHKRPRPATEWLRHVERARQPTGGWKVDDYCMTPSGRLSRVVAVGETLDLQYVRESGVPYSTETVDVTLRPFLCRWLTAREVKALKRPEHGHQQGGEDAAA